MLRSTRQTLRTHELDRVVLTLNYAARNITLNVKKGTPAQSPTAPALSRTEGVIWEIALADIAVAAGATAITAADITDTRPDSNALRIYHRAHRPDRHNRPILSVHGGV